jgi:hypothetical protein
LLVLGFLACEKPANVDLPSAEPKPVVFAFLSPEEQEIKVSVTLSNPIFTNKRQVYNFKQVTNALVQLENGIGQKITLTYDGLKLAYAATQTQMPIIPGISYKVSVSFDKYAVFGETTIPAKAIPFTKVEINQEGRDNFNNIKFGLYARWQDPANEVNYYRTLIESKYVWNGTDTLYSSFQYDKVLSEPSNDGKEMLLRYNVLFNDGALDQKNYLDVYLLHTDYNYYEYHKRRLSYVGEDIFVEPLPMYSNIKGGGLGVVGSYRKVRSTVEVLR